MAAFYHSLMDRVRRECRAADKRPQKPRREAARNWPDGRWKADFARLLGLLGLPSLLGKRAGDRAAAPVSQRDLKSLLTIASKIAFPIRESAKAPNIAECVCNRPNSQREGVRTPGHATFRGRIQGGPRSLAGALNYYEVAAEANWCRGLPFY